ncbi:MAG: hypothetical protein ACSHW1_11935 [Yoonia sp.]|uniref:hypothetical protein n=1 Tax=Yoonia sp. TaxID=2212373 RepID=UPI003EF27D5E
MTKIFFALSFGLGVALAAMPVQAQSANCADHAQVVSALAARYGESRQSIGLSNDNTVVEVFASTDTGTWTITITQPGGPTCLVAAGQAYQHVAEDLPNADSDA